MSDSKKHQKDSRESHEKQTSRGSQFYFRAPWVFDRIFRTIVRRRRPFNRAMFGAARDRYGLVERHGRLFPSTDLAIDSKLSGFMK